MDKKLKVYIASLKKTLKLHKKMFKPVKGDDFLKGFHEGIKTCIDCAKIELQEK